MAVAIKITGDYLTPEEAADELGLTADTIRRYCNHTQSPKLKGEKLGRDWLIPKKEVERYKRERRETGRPPKSDD